MKFYSLILLTKHVQILCESFENGLNLMLDGCSMYVAFPNFHNGFGIG